MPIRIDPSYEYAAVDPGNLLQTSSGRRYMVIRHTPFFTEVIRYYWFDDLIFNATSFLTRQLYKLKKGFKKGLKRGSSTKVKRNDTES